ncbi:HDIG domain-containing metalloprotein [Chloroflexota bacterium]
MTKEEARTVKEYFPLIRRIKDKGLREKVTETWVRIWKESGYSDLREAPFSPYPQDANENLVRHTNTTTKLALVAAEQFQDEYEINIDFDILLASAILHDLDKAVIYQKKGNEVVFSELGNKIPHGAYGMHIALEMGLPLEVAHVIVTHSNLITMEPNTVEGVLAMKAEHVKLGARRTAVAQL